MRSILYRLEWIARHYITYPLLKYIFKNEKQSLPVDINSINSVLILRYDRIGDYVVTTPFIETLKQLNPRLTIDILASPNNSLLAKNEPFLRRVYVWERGCKKRFRILQQLRRQRYSMVFSLVYNRTTYGAILANIITPHGIKVGKGEKKYEPFFNILVTVPSSQKHITEIHRHMITSVFGADIEEPPGKYRIFISDSERDNLIRKLTQAGLSMVNGRALPFAVVNISASSPIRTIEDRQFEWIIEALKKNYEGKIVVIASREEQERLEALRDQVYDIVILGKGEGLSLEEVAGLIQGAQFLITPDSGPIHLASSASIPLFGIYRDQDITEWTPRNTIYRVIYANKYGLIKDIPKNVFVTELAQFLEMLRESKKI